MVNDELISNASSKSKNIVVLCDGTGQRGGIYFDEARTNIYKLYRATRVAPDSAVSPSLQLAFYDPGLGTQPAEGLAIERLRRWIYNLISQATGLGITQNIIDCYAALIQMWRPGDRIFLFGFSRGAYTARCLASVVCMCGIPTTGGPGKALKRDKASAHKFAREAVQKVYQQVSSPKDTRYLHQRELLAANFRTKYGADSNGEPNAYPFFIGVFDTVAALSNTFSLVAIVVAYLIFLAVASCGLSFVGQNFKFWLTFLALGTAFVVLIIYMWTHLKFAWLPGINFIKTIHLTSFRHKFYDEDLNKNVRYARHAIAIDEHRVDFARVPWGQRETKWTQNKIWAFEQYWFAGNHADIGGGYPETEARLSDIALDWMIHATQSLEEESLIIDRSVLNIHPDAGGLQHDETKTGVFRFGEQIVRVIPPGATLHPSVQVRFTLPGVQQYDVTLPYRPEGLRHDPRFADYY